MIIYVERISNIFFSRFDKKILVPFFPDLLPREERKRVSSREAEREGGNCNLDDEKEREEEEEEPT